MEYECATSLRVEGVPVNLPILRIGPNHMVKYEWALGISRVTNQFFTIRPVGRLQVRQGATSNELGSGSC